MRNEPITQKHHACKETGKKKEKSKLWSCAWKCDSLSLFTRIFTSSKLVSNCIKLRRKGRIGGGEP